MSLHHQGYVIVSIRETLHSSNPSEAVGSNSGPRTKQTQFTRSQLRRLPCVFILIGVVVSVAMSNRVRDISE